MQVKNLALGWLKQGLKERCITRDLSWGVKVPLKGYEDKVFYVWFDNVIGYVSSTVELLGKEGQELWKDKKVKTYYFIGKDNIPFHTIFWPGQIMAEGSYVLPYNVVGLQYLNFEGQKFSKSKNVGIFSDQVIKSGVPLDYWRFYLNSILPETKDSDFSLQEFMDRINKELIGNFGNFFHRTLDFIWKKFDGKVPEIKTIDQKLEKEINQKIDKIEESYESCNLREALTTILHLSDLGNQYFNKKEPWKTNDQDALNYCYEIARIISLLLTPIIPNSVEKAFKILNTKNKSLEINHDKKTIKQPKILFKKLEEKDLKLFQQQKFPLQMKVGKIVEVNNHPNAEKLYLLKVDFGNEKRQVVSGLRDDFTKKELLGKKSVFCLNLKKAKFRGENSEAMILMAEDAKEKLAFLEPQQDVGEEVCFSGMKNESKEISYSEFSKLKMVIKKGKVVCDGNILKKVSVDIADGAKIC